MYINNVVTFTLVPNTRSLFLPLPLSLSSIAPAPLLFENCVRFSTEALLAPIDAEIELCSDEVPDRNFCRNTDIFVVKVSVRDVYMIQ